MPVSRQLLRACAWLGGIPGEEPTAPPLGAYRPRRGGDTRRLRYLQDDGEG